jgi:hypothetical protein
MSGEDTRFNIVLEEDVERPEVLVNMIQVNHGTLMEGGSPATLIVMKFQFLPTGNHRRFKVVKAMMKFSKGSNSGTNPEVVETRHCPEGCMVFSQVQDAGGDKS